jgi:hypothetical protein
LCLRGTRKPGAPGVIEGKGKEKGTELLDTHYGRATLHPNNNSAKAW